ncbi:hypothetical protein [Pseudoduganella sp. R-34]|uniref:hypothetical protein n=1 Tax=unclassified Pseudoduganella TaxID=2637179 RepID=UPI003CF4DDA1
MVTSVSGVTALVRMIRSQLAPHGAAAGRRAPSADGRAAATPDGTLARLVEQRVRAIGRDDPQRGRKALRVFLEAVLLDELGQHLLADPRFFRMVDEVQEALEQDDSCQPLLEQAMAQLLATGGQDGQ